MSGLQMSAQNLHEQLKRQITFLRNSVALYDVGCREEAIRMAVIMRILFYDKGRGDSLFKQLGIKNTLQVVTTAKSVDLESLGKIDFGELMSGMIFGNELEYLPVEQNAPTISITDWWDQPVFIRDERVITRGQLVLAAAHKDGGAHVDEADDDLRAIQVGFWIQTQVGANGETVSRPMENNHFRMLRRFADELLNSEELLSVQ